MPKYTLFILFTFLSYTGFAQNTAIEKVWQLNNVYGNVYVYSAIDKFIKSPDVFELNKNGNIITIQSSTSGLCGNEKRSDANSPFPQIKGKWRWVNSSIIEIEYPEKGKLFKKRFEVSKLTDNELILIDLHQ